MSVRMLLSSALAVLLAAVPAFADSINVPDYDFSDPAAPTSYPFAAPSSAAGLGSWQVPPPTAGFLYYEETTGSLSEADATSQWYQQAGVFYNNPSFETINNTPVAQAAFMVDTPGLSLSQTLSTTYQAGQSYQLTVGLGGGSRGMPIGDPIQIGLFYMSGGSQTLIGTTTVANDNSALSGPGGYVYTLPDYTFNLPTVSAADPWAGQNIGVILTQPDAYGSHSYWDVDNVRLTAVPEPGSMALVGAAGLGLVVLGRRRFRTKQTVAAHA